MDRGHKLYFAYSGALDRQAFAAWAEEHGYQHFGLPEGSVAEAKGIDLIFDFPSRWWGGRVAGLIEKHDSSIFGRVFEIAAEDWPIIQHKEGVVTGMSVEKTLLVQFDDQEFEAITFVTAPNRRSLDGPVSERYLEALTRGARQSGLPESYIESLRDKAK